MKHIFTFLLFLFVIQAPLLAQKTAGEQYGNTLNLGVGVGYYGYISQSIPAFHADYELNVARNFTLAPFITVLSYQNYYYWGDNGHAYRDYSYRRTIIPVGLKGTYYFDQLLGASSKWDFYLGASLGFAFRTTRWENGYYGETTVLRGSSSLYLDGHIGAEYHFNQKIGLLLDLSSGISTLCVAIHL